MQSLRLCAAGPDSPRPGGGTDPIVGVAGVGEFQGSLAVLGRQDRGHAGQADGALFVSFA